MKTTRRLLILVAVASLAVVVSCGRDGVITAPRSDAPRANASLLGDVDGLTRSLGLSLLSCNVTQAASATKTIGRAGGQITVGAHSFFVPAGALDSEVTITAVAPAGNRVRVEFSPAGLRFNRAAYVTLSYRDCGVLSWLVTRVVYIDERETILEVLPSLPDLLHQRVTGSVRHFSSYAVAY